MIIVRVNIHLPKKKNNVNGPQSVHVANSPKEVPDQTKSTDTRKNRWVICMPLW